MTTIRKIVPDEVLNELAELAAIPPGIGLWQPHEKFVFDVLKCIRMVHDYGNILDASKLKRLKEIAYHADELAQHLKASSEKKLFALLSSDTIRGITGLARGVRRATLLAKAPRKGKWPVKIRKAYVEGILDAAAAAGGRLTLNRRKEGGSLVDALSLLDPYLPKEGVLLPLSKEWSFSTLRRIYDPWSVRNKTVAQKREKSSRQRTN
ncbi:MAG: hypothetical protein WA728_25100 [Xanthobacteraceae bacterium]